MVLTQPKLRANENIIDLHCLVWEDRGSDVALWPSLVMEFCPITLAELQAQIPTPLGKTIKALLIQGIGNGMDALHEEDFIHGDLKSENILIQFEGEAVMVPKISDFGSAILVWESENLVPVGGTDPWRAPELIINHGYVALRDASLTDDYSFALLCWRVLLDGTSPFRHLLDLDLDLDVSSSADVELQIQELKVSNKLGDLCARDLEEAYGSPLVSALRAMLHADPQQRTIPAGLLVEHLLAPPEQVDVAAEQTTHPYDVPKTDDALVVHLIPNTFVNLPEYCRYDLLAPSTRASEATRRHIFGETLAFLTKWLATEPEGCKSCSEMSVFDQAVIGTPVSGLDDFIQLVEEGHQRHTCRGLESEAFVSRHIPGLACHDSLAAILNLATCYLNGYGTEPDLDAALEWLVIGGRRGAVYRGELLGIFTRLEKPLPKSVPFVKWAMEALVIHGSLPAANTLRQLYPAYFEVAQQARWRLFDGDDIATDNFYSAFRFENLTSASLSEAIEALQRELDDDKTRYYSPLHTIASAWPQPVDLCRRAVAAHPDLLDQPNSAGETPLLLACRAGRLLSATTLIQLGADVAIQAGEGGETALHWLAIQEGSEHAMDMLLRHGADPNAAISRSRMYPWQSAPMAHMDRPPYWYLGTPLHWAVLHEHQRAVELLLSRGARADVLNIGSHNPCQIAAGLRNPRLLGTLLNSLAGGASTSLCSQLLRELVWFDSTPYRRLWLGYTTKDEIETLDIILQHLPQNITTEETENLFQSTIMHAVQASSISLLGRILEALDFGLQIAPDGGVGVVPGLPLVRPMWHESLLPLSHDAVLRNDPKVLDMLLQKGLDVAQRDILGYSCLHILARTTRNAACLEVLLRHGAKLDWKNDSGHTPVQMALLVGNTALAEAMVSKMSTEEFDKTLGKQSWGAVPNPRVENKLMFNFLGTMIRLRGAFGTNISGIGWLIDRLGPENCLVVSSNADTVFHPAVDGLDDKRSVWRDIWSLPLLKILLDRFHSPDQVSAPNRDGVSPLHLAAWLGKDEEMRLLIKAGANINAVSNSPAGTPLDATFLDPPDYFTPLQRSGTLTKIQVMEYINGRNTAAKYLRDAGALSLQEIRQNVRLGDWIPFPFGAPNMLPTFWVLTRPPLLARYGRIVVVPRWSTPVFLGRVLKTREPMGVSVEQRHASTSSPSRTALSTEELRVQVGG